jgi:hypothetical protein
LPALQEAPLTLPGKAHAGLYVMLTIAPITSTAAQKTHAPGIKIKTVIILTSRGPLSTVAYPYVLNISQAAVSSNGLFFTFKPSFT